MEAAQQTATTETPGCPGGAKPGPEHEWLHRMIGEWTCEGEATPGPGQPPVKWKATEVVRSIGGMWVMGEGTSEMPGGGTGVTLITLGYDPGKGRYVGSFVGSMMNNIWVYEGTRNGSVLTLDTEGPAMSGSGGMAKYQDIVEMLDDNTRTLRSVVQGPDGQWQQVMNATYRRTK